MAEPTFIAKCEEILEELEGHGMLEAYAAHAAVSELVRNWKNAIHDGYEPDKLIGDIELTIEELRLFLRLLQKETSVTAKSETPQ